MSKLIITLAVALISSSAAAAEWMQIPNASDNTFNLHLNMEEVINSGNKAKMWVMYDSTSAQALTSGEKYLSVKMLNEYDCKEIKSRTIFYSWHSENMGVGTSIRTKDSPKAKWKLIPPRSDGKISQRIACLKNVGQK
tara:strand:+ start:804 stop:1217 length:414 start_codon:yes stop_codon:yes gene_type:complete